MLTKLEKTIPLLTSNDQSQIVNAIQLLDTMYDLYPSEVEQVWSLLPPRSIEPIWKSYFRSKYHGEDFDSYLDIKYASWPKDRSRNFKGIFIQVHSRRDRRIKKQSTIFLSMAFQTDSPGLSTYFQLPESYIGYARIANDNLAKYHGIEEIESITMIMGNTQEEKELLDLDMSTFDAKRFYPMLTLLNSPFVEQKMNEFFYTVENYSTPR